jgi:hypothetical protein
MKPDVTYNFRINSINLPVARSGLSDTLVMTANVRAMSNATGDHGLELASYTLALGKYQQGSYIPEDAMNFRVSSLCSSSTDGSLNLKLRPIKLSSSHIR